MSNLLNLVEEAFGPLAARLELRIVPVKTTHATKSVSLENELYTLAIDEDVNRGFISVTARTLGKQSPIRKWLAVFSTGIPGAIDVIALMRHDGIHIPGGHKVMLTATQRKEAVHLIAKFIDENLDRVFPGSKVMAKV